MMASQDASMHTGVDGAAVAKRATESYLMQVLQHGFLHSGSCFTCLQAALGSSRLPAVHDALPSCIFGSAFLYAWSCLKLWSA